MLLERGFPVGAVNDYSEVEKGPGRPPHWEMVFWWTRKPLAGARAVIAASLLTEEDVKALGGSLLDLLFPCRGGRKTVHTCNPSPRLVERLKGKKLLNPFAGFGFFNHYVGRSREFVLRMGPRASGRGL